MSTIRIERVALDQIQRALEQYRELLADLERQGIMAENTTKTYFGHSQNFVRWLAGEFEPGARNRR